MNPSAANPRALAAQANWQSVSGTRDKTTAMELVVAGSAGREDAGGNEPDAGGLSLHRHSKDHTMCRWTIAPFSKVSSRCLQGSMIPVWAPQRRW